MCPLQVFVDVTLSCEGGQQLRAHKVVLAACSPYFQAVLQNNPCKHPIVILPRDVAFADLRAIIEFVYRGEIDVAQEQINSLLAAADTLKIKGLCEVGDDPTHVPPGFTATPSSASRHAASASSSGGLNASSSGSSHTPRGRGSYTRGRYNTSYRPRGRPPLYGRHRYERPSPNAPRSNDHHDHPVSSVYWKRENVREFESVCVRVCMCACWRASVRAFYMYIYSPLLSRVIHAHVFAYPYLCWCALSMNEWQISEK